MFLIGFRMNLSRFPHRPYRLTTTVLEVASYEQKDHQDGTSDGHAFCDNCERAILKLGPIGSARFGFRSTEPLSFFCLATPSSASWFGFGRSAEIPSEKQLRFLIFLTHKQRGWGTHNPLVPGSSPGGPTIFIRFI